MHYKKITLIAAALGYLLSLTSEAAVLPIHTEKDNLFRYPAYVGVTVGYGATTWGFLISPDPNAAMTLATPIEADENGLLWGMFVGYEIMPTFALELSYDHYPSARVIFDPDSLFSFEHNDQTSFVTDTETISLMGKLMLMIPHNPKIRAYSSLGASYVYRDDIMMDKWTLRPKFGLGINYMVKEHWMLEWGFDYTAGDAISELNPSNSFIPFLYTFFMRTAFRF